MLCFVFHCTDACSSCLTASGSQRKVVEEHLDENSRLVRVRHPQNAAAVTDGTVVARHRETVANVQHLLWPRSQIALQRLQAQRLVAHIDEHIVSAVEGTKRKRRARQLRLHGERNLLERLVDDRACGDNPAGTRLAHHLHGQTKALRI